MATIAELVRGKEDWRGVKLQYTGVPNSWPCSLGAFPEYFLVRSHRKDGSWELNTPEGKFCALILFDDPNWELYIDPPKLKSKKDTSCTCDIHLLMRAGCSCGAFQREKEGKNESVSPKTLSMPDWAGIGTVLPFGGRATPP